MPKLPGINHLQAIRALQKAGFVVVREGKHTVLSDGSRILTIPRHNPINAFTMGGIVKDAGLSFEEFKSLLWGYPMPLSITGTEEAESGVAVEALLVRAE